MIRRTAIRNRRRHARPWNQWVPPGGGPPEFAPLRPATTIPELWRAIQHRLTARRCPGSLARYPDGQPCLPEMTQAAYWSDWGAFFIESTRSRLTAAQRLDAETKLRVALGLARHDVGLRGFDELTTAEALAVFDALLAGV